jgi:linearmycin/streptolysin S transport system permease protein
MLVWILARKDLRLLLRDPRAVVVLLAMPLIFILVLGISLGEGFGQKPDDRLRISVVDLDKPYIESGGSETPLAWSKVVQRDLARTAGIRVEVIPTLEDAEQLVKGGKRAAVLVFGPEFSRRVTNSSFLPGGVNPLFRDGVDIKALDARFLTDPTQLTAASIIEQVGQVTMLRVVLPWMIGRAFERIGNQMGPLVKNGLQAMFPSYNLTGKTWAALTRAEERSNEGAEIAVFSAEGTGLLGRGAQRYQTLVPSYTVMFSYFLVLTVGWLFVAERRQGTLKRLRAAPLSRSQILLGKLIPCLALSLAQGLFLLGAGKLIFNMSFGPEPWWLLAVVFATSLSAMGLALLVASVARSEAQVAIYGTLLVLVLAGISGCLMGDRDLMPESMKQLSLITPHAWALIAYKQLLANQGAVNVALVAQACAALTAFGFGFILLAWCFLRLDTQT